MNPRKKKISQQPLIICYAMKSNSNILHHYLSEMHPDVLQQTDTRTNGTAYHFAAYCGHLENLKCLVSFGSKQDLLKVNNEGCTVLDTALDSLRPSAQVFIYLLFEAKVPFGADTLELLKKKKVIFAQKIVEAFPKDNRYLEQLDDLLHCAGQPEWERRRRANFIPKLPTLLTLAGEVVKCNSEFNQLSLPAEVSEKITETPMSLKSLAAFRFMYTNQKKPQYEQRSAMVISEEGEEQKLEEMSAEKMKETCSDTMNELTHIFGPL